MSSWSIKDIFRQFNVKLMAVIIELLFIRLLLLDLPYLGHRTSMRLDTVV